MALIRNTFCLEKETARRLKEFSRRTGFSQSMLMDQMVSQSLDHLEKHWKPLEQVVTEALAQGVNLPRSTPPHRRRSKRT